MAKLITMSEAVSIALHSMVLIARNTNLISVVDIAESYNVSKHHVSKVLQRLVKDGFLISTRGPAGGFKLKRPASDISMLQIYECIEGPIQISKCVMENPICPLDKCLMSNIIYRLSTELRDYLAAQHLSAFI